MWHDSEVDFGVDEIYQVLIWEDNNVEESEPMFRNWISNTTIWVVTPWVAGEIGLEPEKTYYWKVKKFSQSKRSIISTDIGLFSYKRTIGPEELIVAPLPFFWGTVPDNSYSDVELYPPLRSCEETDLTQEPTDEFTPCCSNGRHCRYFGYPDDPGSYCVHHNGILKSVYIHGPITALHFP
jgi:hypothetical protein